MEMAMSPLLVLAGVLIPATVVLALDAYLRRQT